VRAKCQNAHGNNKSMEGLCQHHHGACKGRALASTQFRDGGAEMVRHYHLEIDRMCAQLEIVRHFLSIGNSKTLPFGNS
jgi:hypothetical protein